MHGGPPGDSGSGTGAEDFDEMVSRYRSYEKTLKDIPPLKCREGCLNGAYARKDGG